MCVRDVLHVCVTFSQLSKLSRFFDNFYVKQKKVHKERSIQVNEVNRVNRVNRDRISTFAYVREKKMLLAPVHISNSDV